MSLRLRAEAELRANMLNSPTPRVWTSPRISEASDCSEKTDSGSEAGGEGEGDNDTVVDSTHAAKAVAIGRALIRSQIADEEGSKAQAEQRLVSARTDGERRMAGGRLRQINARLSQLRASIDDPAKLLQRWEDETKLRSSGKHTKRTSTRRRPPPPRAHLISKAPVIPATAPTPVASVGAGPELEPQPEPQPEPEPEQRPQLQPESESEPGPEPEPSAISGAEVGTEQITTRLREQLMAEARAVLQVWHYTLRDIVRSVVVLIYVLPEEYQSRLC